MAKWNPSSSVNSNHLLTIVRRGDLAYLTYIRDLTMLSVANELNPLTIQVGVDAGYLPSDAVATLWPTKENVT